MTTFKQWVNGVGYYESKSDFIWAVREGLMVFVGLELLVVFMALVSWLVMGVFNDLLLAIGSTIAVLLGYIRFGIQWRFFN
jgi:hypothetical protein